MPARAVVVWVGLVALLAALSSSGPAPSPRAAALLGVIVALVVGIGARTSILFAALRTGRLAVAADGAVSRSPLLVGLVATAITAPLIVGGASAGVGGGVGAAWPVALGGIVAVVVGLVWPQGGALRPSSTSLALFLGRGALVAALMAAAMGAVVAVGRFGLDGEVAPGAFSRVLAGTFLCDALLGVGGFVRADVALASGLVRVETRAVPDAPGPVLLALALAAPTVILLPSLLPPVTATMAVIVKVVAGAIVGGLLHLAGGLRGAKRALA
jgi:hypothetical protein